MTTIAWDGKTLAADRLAITSNNGFLAVPKIHKFHLATGTLLFAGAGSLDAVLAMYYWVQEGCRRDYYPPSQTGSDWAEILVVHEKPQGVCGYQKKTGHLFVYMQSPFPLIADINQYALGSGARYAVGAMSAGASAENAVLIASRFDKGTGDQVETLDFEH